MSTQNNNIRVGNYRFWKTKWKHRQGQVLRARPRVVYVFAPTVADGMLVQRKAAELGCRMFDVCWQNVESDASHWSRSAVQPCSAQ